MDNNLLRIKVKQRLNKLDSQDYDNVECWQIAEAFNKAQLEWSRNQVHGSNQHQEGDESSKVLIDDLQPILTSTSTNLTSGNRFYQTEVFPTNYLGFKRMEAKSSSDCCDARNMRIHLKEEANVEDLLADELNKPSIEWGETFCTLRGNRVRIYTNDEFNLEDGILHYYRKPVNVEFNGCVNPSDDTAYTADVICEFKDDVVELLIEWTVAILSGDVELYNNYQRSKQNTVENN